MSWHLSIWLCENETPGLGITYWLKCLQRQINLQIYLHCNYLTLTHQSACIIYWTPCGQNFQLCFTAFLLLQQRDIHHVRDTAHCGFLKQCCSAQKERGSPWQVVRTADLEHKDSMSAQAGFALMPNACQMNYKHIPFTWIMCGKTVHRIPCLSFFRLSPCGLYQCPCLRSGQKY